KIDTDAYDGDVIQETELVGPEFRDPAQVIVDAKQKHGDVRSALARNDVTGVLSIALDRAPYGPNVDEAKNLTLQTVASILNSTRLADIPAVLKGLSAESQDTGMNVVGFYVAACRRFRLR
ncbi:hypothetical protein CONPUDRAFT_66872, partial [Coniophora puteana RWD-64-598 SS2]